MIHLERPLEPRLERAIDEEQFACANNARAGRDRGGFRRGRRDRVMIHTVFDAQLIGAHESVVVALLREILEARIRCVHFSELLERARMPVAPAQQVRAADRIGERPLREFRPRAQPDTFTNAVFLDCIVDRIARHGREQGDLVGVLGPRGGNADNCAHFPALGNGECVLVRESVPRAHSAVHVHPCNTRDCVDHNFACERRIVGQGRVRKSCFRVRVCLEPRRRGRDEARIAERAGKVVRQTGLVVRERQTNACVTQLVAYRAFAREKGECPVALLGL